MPRKPTEELVLEVLAARYRLGERLWTFHSRHRKALEQLEADGLVSVIHGIVEKTVRASLTDKGRAECIDDSYVPPLLKGKPQERFAGAPMVFYGDVVSNPLGFAPSHDRPPYDVVLPDREF